MTSYNFGNVVLVPFPFTDQTTNKKRPAVVISSDVYSGSHKDGVGQNPVFSSVSSLNEYLIYPRSAI